MKIKINPRELSINALSIGAIGLLVFLAKYNTSHTYYRVVLYLFACLGIIKFVTAIFDLVSPIKTKEDPRDAANKAIIKESFK